MSYTFDEEDKKQIDNFYEDAKFPMLVIGLNPYYIKENVCSFKDPSKWKLIETQHGGVACHHRIMYIYELSVRPEVKPKIQALNDRFYDCGYRQSLQQINSYNDYLIQNLGVSCDYSYSSFEEALYPIDPSHENIVKLSNEVLPLDDFSKIDLDKLLIFKTKFSQLIGILNRYDLFILGENSD